VAPVLPNNHNRDAVRPPGRHPLPGQQPGGLLRVHGPPRRRTGRRPGSPAAAARPGDSRHRLAADLPRLWDHPATSAKDRKRLLRAVISDVVTILSEPDSDGIRIGVRWHTGATEEITTTRRGPDQRRRSRRAARWASSMRYCASWDRRLMLLTAARR